MAFRILVHDPSAKVRSDLKAMLTPAGDPAEAVGGDSLSVLLEGAVAPPPGFPEVELEICQRLEAVEGLLKDGLKAGKPFAMVFLDPGPRDDGLALLERLRELDDEVFLVLQVVELFCHPIELMERVSPPDRLFVQHKPFHPFDIQQLVLSCFWRRQGGQETSHAKGADSEQTSGIEAGSSLWDRLPLGLAIFDRQERLLRVNAAFRDLAWRLVEWTMGGYPFDARYRAIIDRNSPFTYVSRIRTPLLIMHASQDLRTGVSQSEMLYRAIKALDRPVEYVRYPLAGHDLSRRGAAHQRMDRLNRIIEFFERHLHNPRPAPVLSGQ